MKWGSLNWHDVSIEFDDNRIFNTFNAVKFTNGQDVEQTHMRLVSTCACNKLPCEVHMLN